MLDSSKLKEFADDYFELDENGGKFSKRVEIYCGRKGETVFKRFEYQTLKHKGLFVKEQKASSTDVENDIVK